MMIVYYSTYIEKENSYWCSNYYDEIRHEEHKDWNFTGRIKYKTSINESLEKDVEMYLEIQDILHSEVKNPNYCKYYGDRRKTIEVNLVYWKKAEFFDFYNELSITEVIYECA